MIIAALAGEISLPSFGKRITAVGRFAMRRLPVGLPQTWLESTRFRSRSPI